ncbi:hypothetical protein KOW79_006828 [Hemibagrus wyckioides]|uniref:Uncharacterized protein n=1 Tax=Hemibagrus wyckioides TaxID=337641 RepID=A0A9D3SMV8_9TELE|nr:hypothetical protein KOW79_006828 [Hemibagrus wyckioides]
MVAIACMWSSSQTAAEDLEANTLSVLLLLITQEFICAEEREENQPFTHSTAIHSHYGSLENLLQFL